MGRKDASPCSRMCNEIYTLLEKDGYNVYKERSFKKRAFYIYVCDSDQKVYFSIKVSDYIYNLDRARFDLSVKSNDNLSEVWNAIKKGLELKVVLIKTDTLK